MTSKNLEKDYKIYDYKRVVIKEKHVPYCIDCYKIFGWTPEDNKPLRKERGQFLIWFRRSRLIANKAELTRLERNFDACFAELAELERSKYIRPTVHASVCGLLGAALIATAAAIAAAMAPAISWLCVLLEILGALGFVLPKFIYRRGVRRRTEAVTPFINAKHMEIDEICAKGRSLL